MQKKINQKNIKKTTKNNWKTFLYCFGALIWVGASVIVSQLIIGYTMLWLLGSETFVEPVPTAIYSALSYILAMLIIIFVPPAIVNKYKKNHIKVANRQTLGLRDLPTWTDIGLAPIGFVVYILLAAGLVALFNIFPWFNAEQAQDIGFSTYIVGFDRIVAFITLVVVAPIFEEIIFRGWLYAKLRYKISQKMSDTTSMIISIFLVSLLFGIVHLQWNVGVNVFAMSIVLCGLRELTGTIYSGIILHMIKNGLAFYLLYVLGVN